MTQITGHHEYRWSWVEIDCGNIIENIRTLRSVLPRNIQVMGVLKADAYGHGIAEIGKAIATYVDCFGVAIFSEAKQLRNIEDALTT